MKVNNQTDDKMQLISILIKIPYWILKFITINIAKDNMK